MSADLNIRCACGALRGVAQGVSGTSGNRIVCYCDDCQSFPHFLQDAERTLDAHGGTDIFQMSPAHLKITKGRDQLLSRGGGSSRGQKKGPPMWQARRFVCL